MMQYGCKRLTPSDLLIVVATSHSSLSTVYHITINIGAFALNIQSSSNTITSPERRSAADLQRILHSLIGDAGFVLSGNLPDGERTLPYTENRSNAGNSLVGI